MAVPLIETPPPVTVAAVRRFHAAARRGPGTGQRIEGIYIAVVVTLIATILVYNAAHSALAQVVSPIEVARWGPSLVLLGLVAAGHWGTVQGPVVFSVADVGHLVLGSPLARRALVTSPLVRALVAAALTGAVVAGVVVVGLSGRGHTVGPARVVDLVAGVALIGILAAVAAFAVSSDRRCERALRRLTGPALIAAAALALAGALAGRTGRQIDMWSGPWGWALQAGAAASTASYVGAIAGLAAVVALAIALVWRRRGSGEAERYLRRAQGHARLQASLMDLNARTARRDLAEVSGRPRRWRARDLRWLRDRLARAPAPSVSPAAGGAVAAVIWRDTLVAVEGPAVLVQALAAGVAGTAVALLDAGRVLAVAAGGVLLYLAAARLLEPLRIENDAPGRSRVFLAARPGRAYIAHTILPAVLVLAVVAVTAAALALGGALARHGAAAALDLILAAPAIVGCAAMSARRGGRLPQSMLVTAMSTDPSGGGAVLLGWLLIWPAAAVALVALPLGGAGSAHGASQAWAVVGVVAAAVLARVLARD
jgi:hypothetical protein